MWSKFTKDNLKLFTNYKYNLNDDNILLNYIKNERVNIINFINNKKISINITKLSEYNNIYKYVDSFFVDKKNLLNDMKNLNYIYKIEWGEDNMIIINTNNEIESNVYIKILIYMIEYLKYKSQDNKKITIYLILSTLEKEFPTLSKMMDVKNSNSGYNDSQENIIFIWRREEFEKVLFHELMHHFDLDKREEHVHNIINTNGKHLYFEAITDFQGIIYHLIYLSIITRKKIKKLLEYELGFIRNQAQSLNNIWGLGEWHGKPKLLIEQKNASFSYYILKYLIFEYFLNNQINFSEKYSNILNNVLDIKFNVISYLRIESSRMTLLQLKEYI